MCLARVKPYESTVDEIPYKSDNNELLPIHPNTKWLLSIAYG